MRKRWIVVLVILVLIITLMAIFLIETSPFHPFIFSTLPHCDHVSGGDFDNSVFPRTEQNCTCLGFKISKDYRHVDGDFYSTCIGITTTKGCSASYLNSTIRSCP